jgi:hypothetical protein
VEKRAATKKALAGALQENGGGISTVKGVEGEAKSKMLEWQMDKAITESGRAIALEETMPAGFAGEPEPIGIMDVRPAIPNLEADIPDVVGCGESQQSAPAPEAKPSEPVAEAAKPEPPTAKAPAISIYDAAKAGNIEAVKQHLDAGADVNAKGERDRTPFA